MNELESLLARLVSIDSINPDLVPGAHGEMEIGDFVADWMRGRGLDVAPPGNGRVPGQTNVIAIARGTGGGRSLMLNAHMDTVGVAGMKDAIRAGRSATGGFCTGRLDGHERRAGRIHERRGRGALAATPRRRDPHGRRRRGIRERSAPRRSCANWKADAAIVGEPSGLQIVTEHKGFVWFQVRHAGRGRARVAPGRRRGRDPHDGESARRDGGPRRPAPDAAPHPTLGTGSLHASLITGGQELSSYPASCRLDVERRTIPGETRRRAAEAEIRAAIDAHCAQGSPVHGDAAADFRPTPHGSAAGTPRSCSPLRRRCGGSREAPRYLPG